MTLLGSTRFWSLLLVLTLAACIWIFGPLLAMADNRFWESPVVRLATISALLLIWGSGLYFPTGAAAGRKGRRRKARQARASA